MQLPKQPKIFITGSTGQVGYELVRDLAHMGEILAPTRAELDLSDEAAVNNYLKSHKPDIIINTAAYTQVDKAEDERDASYRLNTELPVQLAQYCGEVRWLVHFSSDYVYPGTGDTPYVETDATGPLSYYGLTKRDGDDAVQARATNYYILRTSWVYSYRGSNFLRTMLRLAETHTELRVVNDQISTPTSAQFLSTITRVLLERIATHQSAEPGLYHAVPNGATSWAGFAQAIFDRASLLGLKSQHGTEAAHFSSESDGSAQKISVKPQVHGIPSSDYPSKAARPLNSRLSNQKLAQALHCELPAWDATLSDIIERAVLGV